MRKRYMNLDAVPTTNSLKGLYKWQQERRKKQKDLSFIVPSVEPDLTLLQQKQAKTTITWIGHATFLLQLNGYNIVTDPVWAKRLSMYKRLTKPGIPIQEMPPIDYVLISHGHYDHLDLPTLKALPGTPEYLVPEGLGKWFVRKGFDQVAEFSWWATRKIGPLQFTFVPAQHWTRRTLRDTNTSHWGGWILKGNATGAIYFAGDSGYFRGFSEIGEQFNITCALMPIGAYEPEWFMGSQHVNPEEAVKAFLDTDAGYMIPMHYGAFRLADDTAKEALDRMHLAWKAQGIETKRLVQLRHGETFILEEN